MAMLSNLYEYTSRQIEAEEFFTYVIESSWLAGFIDGETQSLVYLWLATNVDVILAH